MQDSLDEQLKTVVHELLQEAINYMENLEKLIEAETEKVLQTQTVLINHLKILIISHLTHPKL